MSVVSLLGVKVVNNPAKFIDKYEFEITFECLEQLEKGMFVDVTLMLPMANAYNSIQISSGSLPMSDLPNRASFAVTTNRARRANRSSSDQYDQELDSLLVGPVPVGVNKFIFEADAPDTSRIPDADIIGVTVVLLTCSYDGREFVRVGYYVNNEYDSPELNAEPPTKPLIDRVKRNVLAEKPRVTRFAIKW